MARAGEEFLTSFLNTIGSGIKERRAKTEAYKEEGYDAAKIGFRTYNTLKANTRQMKDDIDYLKNALGQTSISDEEYLAIAGGKAGISLKALKDEVQKAQLNNRVPDIDASTVKQLVTLNNFVAPKNEQGVVDLDYGLQKLNGLNQQIYQGDNSPPSDKKTAMSLLKAGFALDPKQSAEEYLSKAEYLGLPVNELISVIGSTGKGRLEGLENVSTNYEALSKLKPLSTKQINAFGNDYASQIKALVGDEAIVLNTLSGLFDSTNANSLDNASRANQIKNKVGQAVSAIMNDPDKNSIINNIITNRTEYPTEADVNAALDLIINNGTVVQTPLPSTVDQQLLTNTLLDIDFDSRVDSDGIVDNISLNNTIAKINNISNPALKQAVVKSILENSRLTEPERNRIKTKFEEKGISTSASAVNPPPVVEAPTTNFTQQEQKIIDMFFDLESESGRVANFRKAAYDAQYSEGSRTDKENILRRALEYVYVGTEDPRQKKEIKAKIISEVLRILEANRL